MTDVQTRPQYTNGEKVPLRVLVVYNYDQAKSEKPFIGVYADRQIASLRKAGVKINIFDIGTSHAPWQLLGRWLALRRHVRRHQPDIVHGRYGTIVGFLSACAGRPAVVSFCGSDLLPGASVPFWRMCLGFVLSNLAALRAQGLICVSQELRGALWWRKSRAVVIPDGIDLDLFSPGSQAEARRKLGWPMEQPTVLFNVGGDPGNKGFDLARAAIAVAQSRVPEARLEVVSKVRPDNMPIYHRAADVLLCASRQEGSPNMVKEALACGLPVVSTPVGDIPERLKGVYPSEIVPRDPDRMGEAIARILLMGKRCNGPEVVASLSLDQIAPRVIAVYQSVLGIDARAAHVVEEPQLENTGSLV